MLTVYVVIATIVSVVIALELESRRKRRGDGVKPFAWGYYNGCLGIALLPVAIIFVRAAIEDGRAGIYLIAAWPFVQVVCGYFVLRRRRLAFVVATILSFNPLFWIVNFFYIRNRWDDF